MCSEVGGYKRTYIYIINDENMHISGTVEIIFLVRLIFFAGRKVFHEFFGDKPSLQTFKLTSFYLIFLLNQQSFEYAFSTRTHFIVRQNRVKDVKTKKIEIKKVSQAQGKVFVASPQGTKDCRRGKIWKNVNLIVSQC